jgi:hypothetical protein
MGSGPNYVLDKGYRATGATAYKSGELLIASGTGIDCARATSAAALEVLGVCQEDVDVAKVNTGKVIVDTRLLGIARVLSGAAVAVGDRLQNDTTARAITLTQAAAGAQPKRSFGKALTAATAAGQYIDVLLTPGATF